MSSLEQRRIEQSLIVFFQSFRMQGPSYISNRFMPRVNNYYLRGSKVKAGFYLNLAKKIDILFSSKVVPLTT